MEVMAIKGAIDKLDSEGAIGWLYSREYGAPPVVRAFLHNDFIGEAAADGYRPDLEEVGFGDGRCGFDIRFTRPIDQSYLPFVTIKPQDVDLQLPSAASSAAYLDLVNAAVTGFPGAARNRSVLGGLWTDRTDGPQLLAGRVAVGACPADLQPALQELILNGYVVLHNALAPTGVTAKDLANIEAATGSNSPEGYEDVKIKPALTAIAGLLFRDSVVRLLRAIFDDQPVVYRLESLSGDVPYAQASTFESLPSPGEALAIYVGHPNDTVRLDLIRDSHELPEFSPNGISRWTAAGAEDLSRFATEAGLSVESLELDALDIAIVGPGLVHRVSASEEAPALRAVAAPRRVTPTRFLSGDATWTEVSHVSGARIRV